MAGPFIAFEFTQQGNHFCIDSDSSDVYYWMYCIESDWSINSKLAWFTWKITLHVWNAVAQQRPIRSALKTIQKIPGAWKVYSPNFKFIAPRLRPAARNRHTGGKKDRTSFTCKALHVRQTFFYSSLKVALISTVFEFGSPCWDPI